MDKSKEDFGFSFIDENEIINPGTLTKAEHEKQIELLRGHYQTALSSMFEKIEPLLKNLEKDPSKDIIKWPGPQRAESIKNFRMSLVEHMKKTRQLDPCTKNPLKKENEE